MMVGSNLLMCLEGWKQRERRIVGEGGEEDSYGGGWANGGGVKPMPESRRHETVSRQQTKKWQIRRV